MADNITLNAGAGGDTLAADDISSVWYQRVKLTDGTADSATFINAAGGTEANALRVTIANDSTGLVSIDDNGGSLTVDNGGTFVIQEDGAALTALQLLDDVVATLGTTTYTEATTKGNVIGVVRNDTLAALAGTDNEIAPLQVNASGALYVQEGAAMDVSAATLTVAAHAVTNAGTFVVQEDGAALTALQLIDDIVATLGTTTYTEATTKGNVIGVVRNDTLAALAGTDNEIAPLQVNASGALYIQEGAAMDVSAATLTVAAHAVTNAGTFVVQEDGAALTALQLIDDVVATLGTTTYTEATTKGATVGAVRNDDLATLVGTVNEIGPLQMTQNGALLGCPAANDDYKYAIIDAASSGDNTIQAAAGANIKIRVLAAFLVSAGTVNTRFESGAAGTALTGQMNLVVNSGYVLPFNEAGWFETAANTLLNLELSAGVSVDGAITYIEVDIS